MLRVTTRSVRRYLRELSLVTEVESVEVRPGGAHLWRIKPSERGRSVALRRTQAYALLAPRRVFEVLKGSALFDEIDLALRQVEQVAHRPVARPTTARRRARRRAPRGSLRVRPAGPARVRQPQRGRRRGLPERGRADRPAFPLPRARTAKAARAPASTAAPVCPRAPRRHDHLPRPRRGPGRDARVPLRPDERSPVERQRALRASTRTSSSATGCRGTSASRGRRARSTCSSSSIPRVADAVRARKVHPTQKVAVARDGRVRASLARPARARGARAGRAWLLGFGSAAHVLEPRELADDVAAELRRAALRYGR